MIRTGILAAMVAMIPAADGQTSFDEHFQLAKHGRQGKRESAFSAKCGVDAKPATVRYGESVDQTWTFRPRSTIGRGRLDAEMDFFGQAELWRVDGQPRLLNVWMLIMDTGQSRNAMFCLDGSRKVTLQESLNVFQPVDGTPGGWIYKRLTSFSEKGVRTVLSESFLDKSGNNVKTPKLNDEDLSDAKVIYELEFAQDVIREISKGSR